MIRVRGSLEDGHLGIGCSKQELAAAAAEAAALAAKEQLAREQEKAREQLAEQEEAERKAKEEEEEQLYCKMQKEKLTEIELGKKMMRYFNLLKKMLTDKEVVLFPSKMNSEKFWLVVDNFVEISELIQKVKADNKKLDEALDHFYIVLKLMLCKQCVAFNAAALLLNLYQQRVEFRTHHEELGAIDKLCSGNQQSYSCFTQDRINNTLYAFIIKLAQQQKITLKNGQTIEGDEEAVSENASGISTTPISTTNVENCLNKLIKSIYGKTREYSSNINGRYVSVKEYEEDVSELVNFMKNKTFRTTLVTYETILNKFVFLLDVYRISMFPNPYDFFENLKNNKELFGVSVMSGYSLSFSSHYNSYYNLYEEKYSDMFESIFKAKDKILQEELVYNKLPNIRNIRLRLANNVVDNEDMCSYLYYLFDGLEDIRSGAWSLTTNVFMGVNWMKCF